MLDIYFCLMKLTEGGGVLVVDVLEGPHVYKLQRCATCQGKWSV